MTPVHQIGFSDVIVPLLVFWLSFVLVKTLARRGAKATPLRGPPRKSLIFGLFRYLMDSEDSAVLFEQWAAEYGPVYQFPTVLGSRRTMICDPKANAHFYSKDTLVYVQTGFSRIFIERLVSKHRFGVGWNVC
jgi:hypothetical protein